MSTLEKARAQVRELLEVSVPDGLLDDEHADRLAAKLVDETLRTLGVIEQHNVTVSWTNRVGLDRLQVADLEGARDVVGRMAAREDSDRVTSHMRWCSRWHRT